MTVQFDALSPVTRALLDRWQRGIPLVESPFAAIARDVGISEPALLALLSDLLNAGVISRVGATLRPNTVGASALAAMRVPPGRLVEVAEIVNREPGVNHNYEREHAFNLWFVITGATKEAIAAALSRIGSASGLDVLELPLERAYYIDLGFPISSIGGSAASKALPAETPTAMPVEDRDRHILALIEHGLPLTPRPFAVIAGDAGLTEQEVIGRLDRLVAGGIVTRLGLIVRHRTLGIRANAMAVWDIPDDDVDRLGAALAAEPCVTLCYRRPRRGADWPYNLFCMVHGSQRARVVADIDGLIRRADIADRPHAILFSRRCFKQRGPSLNAA